MINYQRENDQLLERKSSIIREKMIHYQRENDQLSERK